MGAFCFAKAQWMYIPGIEECISKAEHSVMLYPFTYLLPLYTQESTGQLVRSPLTSHAHSPSAHTLISFLLCVYPYLIRRHVLCVYIYTIIVYKYI